MFEEMTSIAKSRLTDLNENTHGLPSPQVTVLLSGNDRIYVAVNDIDGTICDELKCDKNTKIVKMLTMWKDGSVDLSSIGFRKALIKLDKANNNTEIILQGKDGFLIKRLAETIP